MVSKKQKEAVKFCEQVLNIKFVGNINDFNDVSNFLFDYLDDAKDICYEALESYPVDRY